MGIGIIRVVLSIFLFASAVRGQAVVETTPGQEQNQAPASPKPGETCAVEGTVVKATTGETLRKITVQLFPVGRRSSAERRAQPVSALTDAGGRFVFKGIEAGRYSMMASGGSYPPQRYGQQGRFGAGKILELAAGQIAKDIVLRLEPPGVITGTVYDEDGDPAVGAEVGALRSTRRGSRRAFMTNAAAQTNDRGEYRIFGLEAGQYLVVAVDRQPQQGSRAFFTFDGGATDASNNVYLPTYHPGAPDPEQAVPIQVQPGQEVSGIDVTLRLVHAVHVRGLVQGAPSASRAPGRLGGLWVSLQARDSEARNFANYGVGVQYEAGGFDIGGVPPGPYYLTAGWNDGKQQYYGRTQVDVAGTDVDGVNLLLSPPVQLRGSFRAEPVAKLNFGALNLSFEPVDTASMGGAGASVKADGTFVVDNLYEGNYRLDVGGFPEEYYVKSARLGGTDVLESGLNVSQGQPPGQLEVTLSLDGGRVDGSVFKDGKPFGGATVVLVPDPPRRDHPELYSVKTSDELGRYSLLGLPPGDFKLFAWEPAEGLDFQDPDFIKLYEDRGTGVRIEDKKQQNVQLQVIPAEEEQR